MKINSIARNNGIFLGIILMIFSLVLSFINPRMYVSSHSFLLMVPFILIMIKNASDTRGIVEGAIPFKDMFIISLQCALIAITLCTTFEYFLYNWIFPELKDVLREVLEESLDELSGAFSEDIIEKSKEEIEKDNFYGPVYIIMLLIRRFFAPGILMALVIAGIFKRSEPVLQN